MELNENKNPLSECDKPANANPNAKLPDSVNEKPACENGLPGLVDAASCEAVSEYVKPALTFGRCKYCNVNVTPSIEFCPLCHEKVSSTTIEGEYSDLFVERKIRKTRKIFTFSHIYFYVALCLTLIFAVTNYYVMPKYLWSVGCVIMVLYVYIFIRNIWLYKGGKASKVFIQTIMLLIILVAIQFISYTYHWAQYYAMPLVIVVSIILQVVLMFCYFSRLAEFTFYLTLTSLLGFVPILLNYFTKNNFWWPVIACASISFVTLLSILVLAGKLLRVECSKKFHM